MVSFCSGTYRESESAAILKIGLRQLLLYRLNGNSLRPIFKMAATILNYTRSIIIQQLQIASTDSLTI